MAMTGSKAVAESINRLIEWLGHLTPLFYLVIRL